MRAPDLSRATWRKSSYSNASGSCVEIAMLPNPPDGHDIVIRDSKDPQGPVLTFNARLWSDFIVAIKSHDLDPTLAPP